MNKKLFQPIFYALVLIIGILLGQNFVINYSNLGFFDFFSKNEKKLIHQQLIKAIIKLMLF